MSDLGALSDRGPSTDNEPESVTGSSPRQYQLGKDDPNWWRSAVFYQIYPRSFQDTTGSGMGDLAGVTQEMDYLVNLGVDALWLSPFYPSPQVDAGYDVADYCDVDPIFGSLEDFDELIHSAHNRGLKVIVDLVPNHSSDQHPLFQAALASPPGSPERAMYHFVDGGGDDGSIMPNKWRSAFGGPSWTRVTEANGQPGQWYYHLFAPEQPDFNWENPAVAEFFEGVLRFWLSRGVDGFRIDVSDALIKTTTWRDSEDDLPLIPKDEDSAVHPIYRRLREIMDEYPGSMAVIETGAEDQIVALFVRPDEMHQAFNFRFLKSPWGAGVLTEAIEQSLAAFDHVGAPTTWVIDNHDSTRSVTRYARASALTGAYVPEGADLSPLTEEEFVRGRDRVRAITALYLSLPGSAYIYAGQELGLPEVTDIPDEYLQDPIFYRSEGKSRGRDGCRVPLPWAGTKPPFGFGPQADEDAGAGGDAGVEGYEPWLPQPESWESLTEQRQEADPTSMLSLYRQILDLRRENPAMGTGRVTWIQDAEDAEATQTIRLNLESVDADRPQKLTVLVNVGDAPIELPEGRILLSSRPIENNQIQNDQIQPDTAVVIER